MVRSIQVSLVVMYILSTFCVSFCRLKNFNLLFDELYQRQTQWTIPDNELREAVRLAVAEVLLPAYRSFVKRYSSILDTGKSNSKYVRYSPEDLDRMLSEFFEGKARVDHRR
jgi:exocyst complex protein 7